MLGLGNLISPIANLAGTWIQGKVDKAKAETDIKVAKAQGIPIHAKSKTPNS